MIRFAKIILSTGLNALALGLLALTATTAQPAVLPAHLPLYFEANGPEQFLARGHDYQFLISAAGAQMALRKSTTGSAAMRMQFVGANARAEIRGDSEMPGKINYFTGSDPAQWRVGLAMFAQVRVDELYPGIGLVYYGNERLLEYDFTIAPGGNPQAIAMHFDGVDAISINPQGELILKLAGGEIRQPRPVIYQAVAGGRNAVTGGYRLVDAHTVAFAVGKYDRSQPLVIDPVLAYSTYFGGTSGDTAWAVTLDTNGSIYIAGQTFSQRFFTNQSDFPLGPAFSTFGAFQTNYNGGKQAGDAFVAKFGNDGHTVFYLTYLGGSLDDAAYSIAVDSAGNAYVAGATDSTNFPIRNAIPGHTNISGVLDPIVKLYPTEAFVTELDASGSNLVYSTYLGGSGAEAAYGVAVDPFGHAFVTGFTFSTNFPTTTNAMFRHLQCTNSFSFNANAFVTEIASNGGAMLYSTYFGGTNFDQGKGIAVDRSNFVYVTGFTASTNFPNTNSFQKLLNGSVKKTASFDAFVAKFDTNGMSLVYSTFLGGTNNDFANSIAVDTNGAAYVTGWSISTNFPNTITNIAELHSFVATNTRVSDFATNVFLTKITNGIINSTQQVAGIAWSTLFGGKGADAGYGVAVDPAGDEVFVTGSASSTNFPVFRVPGLMRLTNSGKSDAFVIAFTNTAPGTNALLYSGYLGGKDNDFGYGIAVDTNSDAYVVGQTLSTNFPTFNNPQSFRNGTNDGFLTKIILSPTLPLIDTNAEPVSLTNEVGKAVSFSVNGHVTGTPPFFYQWQFGTNLVGGTNLVDATNLVARGNFSGTTNDTLNIAGSQTTNSGYYQVIVTNFGGAVTSLPPAHLLVTNVPPEFTQPASQTNGVGTMAMLAVTVTNGTPPFSYQWQINGTDLVNGGPISGANTNVLTINNVQLTNDATYRVIVTSVTNSVISSNAVLKVQASPLITVQPTGQTNAAGSNLTLMVTAIGTVPLHYQWQYGSDQVNWTNLVDGGHLPGSIIRGATANVLNITNAQKTNSDFYQVIVTNIVDVVTSSIVPVQVTNIPPEFTQPTNQLVGVGTTATLAVTVTNGTAPLSYQWQVDGVDLVNGRQANGSTNSGATTNVLTISNAQTNNSSSNYTVIVTGPGGSVPSSNAVLTVQGFPLITLQPISQTNLVGSNITFVITTVGTVPLRYQWQKDGVNLTNLAGRINGATNNVLNITNAQTTDSSTNYAVIVSNIAGSTNSVVTLLITNALPEIKVQPTNQAVAMGSNVTLVVIATGTGPLSYQWWVNATNLVKNITVNNGPSIRGANTNLLQINNSQTTNSGSYTVIVTNIAGSATSHVAVLTVASSPVIIGQPAPTSQTNAVGSTVSFTVTAVGNPTLRYQWQVDGINLVNGAQTNGSIISGATNNVLFIQAAQTNSSSTNYTVVVTNPAGSAASTNAALTVTNVPPEIRVQPASQTVTVGSNATFTVFVTAGTPPLSYQWRTNGTDLVDDGHFSGTITNLLTITNAQPGDSGAYSVTVTGPGGTVTSNAVLTVTVPLPNFGQIVATGDGRFILSGSGGGSNGTYIVFTSPNLTIPLTNWTSIVTDQFDASGHFIFTNTADPNAPQLFYLLRMP